MSEIRVENIIGETGVDAVNFTKGVNVSGIVTATSFAGSGAALTGIIGGKIGQVLTQIYEPGGSNITTSSTSYVTTSMTLTITPSNTNSKILILGTANGHRVSNANTNAIINVQRAVSGGSTNNLSGASMGLAHTYTTTSTTSTIFFVDGTTGTAQRTYTVVHRVDSGSQTGTVFRANTSNMFMLAEILP